MKQLQDYQYFKQTMLWLAASFTIAALSAAVIGPMVPITLFKVLSLGMLAVLIVVGIIASRSVMAAKIFAIIVPAGLGILAYPPIAYYLSTSPNIIVLALVGTAIAFGLAALMAFKSDKQLPWKFMLGILITIIIMSLLNAFIFHVTFLSLILSIVSVILFTGYSYMDVQRIRQGGHGVHPAMAATSVFLDIYNLFMNLLNILGIASKR